MPLPLGAFTIYGGCNCRAVRYAIDVPPEASRPVHPWSNSTVTFPFIVICHCNDCRAASAGLTLTAICNALTQVRFSLLPRDAPPIQSGEERTFVPAAQVVFPAEPPANTLLATYHSSPSVTRTFCARCGTNLTYARHPLPEGWPPIVDVLLGSVDKEDLERYGLRPDRHVFWDCGVGWIQDLFAGDGGLPRHPRADLRVTC